MCGDLYSCDHINLPIDYARASLSLFEGGWLNCRLSLASLARQSPYANGSDEKGRTTVVLLECNNWLFYVTSILRGAHLPVILIGARCLIIIAEARDYIW